MIFIVPRFLRIGSMKESGFWHKIIRGRLHRGGIIIKINLIKLKYLIKLAKG